MSYIFIHKFFKNKTIRDGGVFAFFSFLNQGLNFFLLIILSWFILPSSYGNLNLFYTAVSVVGFIIHLCTSGIIGIKYFKVPRNILSQYINVVLTCTLATSILFIFGIVFFHDYIQNVAGIGEKLQLLCIYICVFL